MGALLWWLRRWLINKEAIQQRVATTTKKHIQSTHQETTEVGCMTNTNFFKKLSHNVGGRVEASCRSCLCSQTDGPTSGRSFGGCVVACKYADTDRGCGLTYVVTNQRVFEETVSSTSLLMRWCDMRDGPMLEIRQTANDHANHDERPIGFEHEAAVGDALCMRSTSWISDRWHTIMSSVIIYQPEPNQKKR